MLCCIEFFRVEGVVVVIPSLKPCVCVYYKFHSCICSTGNSGLAIAVVVYVACSLAFLV